MLRFPKNRLLQGSLPVRLGVVAPEWKEAIEAKKKAAEKAIDELLDDFEQGVTQLEEALRTARAAELYNNPYATIHQHAAKLLNRLLVIRMSGYAIGYAVRVAITEPITWTSQQRLRLDSLISRLEKLRADCRAEAERRKPVPPVAPPPQVTPPAGWPEAWPEVGIIPPDKWALTAPVTDYQDVVGFPVEERLAYWLEEPELAAAPPAPWWRRNLLSLAVIGGLGTAVVGVAIAKAKKKAKR